MHFASSASDLLNVDPLTRIKWHPASRCSVQRIAKRSGALAQDRIALLDAIAFDWAGADALS